MRPPVEEETLPCCATLISVVIYCGSLSSVLYRLTLSDITAIRPFLLVKLHLVLQMVVILVCWTTSQLELVCWVTVLFKVMMLNKWGHFCLVNPSQVPLVSFLFGWLQTASVTCWWTPRGKTWFWAMISCRAKSTKSAFLKHKSIKYCFHHSQGCKCQFVLYWDSFTATLFLCNTTILS